MSMKVDRLWQACVFGWLVAACFAPHAAKASSCGDETAMVDKRLESVGKTSPSANSAGQAVAAERGAHAKAGNSGPAPEASSNAPERTDATGGAGDAFMAAKVAVNDARNAAKKGDEAGCEAALTKARKLGHL